MVRSTGQCTVDNQWRCGAKVAGWDLCDLKSNQCVGLRQIVVYPHLTEDREPTSPSRVASLGLGPRTVRVDPY